MSITAAELIVYGSASMALDDTTLNIGGAIDVSKRLVFTDITPSGDVEIISSAAGDTTQTVTVYGRDAAGVLISDTKTLNGTTAVAVTGTFERILRAVVSGTHTGIVTLRKATAGGDLMVFAVGELDIRRPFYDTAADASGGAARTYFEKVFFKNTNATLALTAATIALQADPSGKITFALESSLSGTDTNGAGNNRQVAPAAYTFNTTTKNVANSGNHTAAAGQGVWLKLSLAAGDAAQKTSFTLRESGTTV